MSSIQSKEADNPQTVIAETDKFLLQIIAPAQESVLVKIAIELVREGFGILDRDESKLGENGLSYIVLTIKGDPAKLPIVKKRIYELAGIKKVLILPPQKTKNENETNKAQTPFEHKGEPKWAIIKNQQTRKASG